MKRTIGALVLGVMAASAAPALAASPGGLLPQAAGYAAMNPVTPLTATSFATPPQNDKPSGTLELPARHGHDRRPDDGHAGRL